MEIFGNIMKKNLESHVIFRYNRVKVNIKKFMYLRWPFVLLLIAIIFIISLSKANSNQVTTKWPKIILTNAVEKEFRMVNNYQYRERMYDPPVEVMFLSAEPENYSGPEAVFLSQMSAMKALDYNWWLNTWDSVSRKKIIETDQKLNRSIDTILKEWKKRFTSNRVEYVRWIESGKYVILTYKITPFKGKQKEYPLVFKLWEGRWAATMDLEEDPVLLYFGENKGRIERIIR